MYSTIQYVTYLGYFSSFLFCRIEATAVLTLMHIGTLGQVGYITCNTLLSRLPTVNNAQSTLIETMRLPFTSIKFSEGDDHALFSVNIVL